MSSPRGLHWRGNHALPESGYATDGHLWIDCAYAQPWAAASLTVWPASWTDDDEVEIPPSVTRDKCREVFAGHVVRATIPAVLGQTWRRFSESFLACDREDGLTSWVNPHKIVFLRGCVDFDRVLCPPDPTACVILVRGAVPVAGIMPLRYIPGEDNPDESPRTTGELVELPRVPEGASS